MCWPQGRLKPFLLNLMVAFAIIAVTGVDLQAQVSGTVFRDFTTNGSLDGGDVGLVGMTVTATDANGNTATDVTDFNGAYSIALGGCAGPVRVVFEIDAYNAAQPSAAYHIFDSFAAQGGGGTGNASTTSVTFEDCGSTNVNYGVSTPEDYCNTQPDLVTTCFNNGDPLCPDFDGQILADPGDPAAIIKFEYTDSGPGANYDSYPPSGNNLPTRLAQSGDVGATWGVAYDNNNDCSFVTSVTKRHSGYGPLGTGGIYSVCDNGGITQFFDVGTCTNTGSLNRNDLTCDRRQPNNDIDGYLNAGKVGLGDIDMSEDGTELWVTNLNTKQLVRIQIRNTPGGALIAPGCGSVTTYNIPTPCGATTRPWAVEWYRGQVYVGAVCEDASNAYVWKFDPNGGANPFTQVLQYPLNYANKGEGGGGDGDQWLPWCNTFCDQNAGGFVLYPQPVLTDIEFDGRGNMIMGFLDRTGFQTGYANTFDGELRSGLVAGDIRIAYEFNGNFFPEQGGNLVDQNGNVLLTGDNQGGAEGTEFFDDGGCCTHREVSAGGLEVVLSEGDVLMTGVDNVDNLIWAGGVSWLDLEDGTKNDAYDVYYNADNVAFAGKSVGIGDIEAQCGMAPLEVGNFVWIDTNGNGIQDPGELPVAGVTVEIYKNGTNVGSTTTGPDGSYYFNDGNVNGGLLPNMEYKVCIPSAELNGGTLDGFDITTANAGGNDRLDSDAVLDAQGDASITFTTGNIGENDHSLDFGFGEQDQGCEAFTVISQPVCGVCNGVIELNTNPDLIDNTNQWFFELFDNPNFTGEPIKLNATLSPPDVFDQLCPGTYSIRVTGLAGDVAGCEQLITPIVLEDQAENFNPSVVSTLDADCGEENGSITVDAGEPGSYTYTINPGGTIIDGGQTAVFQNLGAGTYTINIESDLGCTASLDGIELAGPGQPSISFGDGGTDCLGEGGEITATVTGGSAPYEFVWSSGLIETTNGTSTESGLQAGTYNVIVTDAEGCEVTGSVTLGGPTPIAVALVGKTDETCAGGDGSAEITVTGGAGDFTIDWELNGSVVANGLTAGNLAAGFYVVTATDGEGCTAILNVEILSGAFFNPTVQASTDADCGETNGSITVNAGAAGAYTYTITPTGTSADGNDTFTFQNLGAGTYTIDVESADGCTATLTATLAGPGQPVLTVAGDAADCLGQGGGATATVTGGQAPYDFVWSTGFNESTGGTSTIADLQTGTYTVMVTDAAGCEAEGSITVGGQIPIILDVVAKTDESCDGSNDGAGTVMVTGGTGTVTIEWTLAGAVVATGANQTGLAPGFYTVTATDDAGCSSTVNVEIGEGEGVAPSLIASDNNADNCEPGNIVLTVIGAGAGATYEWFQGTPPNGTSIPGATGSTYTVAMEGTATYYVVVTDPDGCTGPSNPVEVTLTPCEVDLAVTKDCLLAAGADAPTVGDEIVFIITATNNGPGADSGVTVTEQLPASLQFVSATTTKGAYADPVWTIGDLLPGETQELELTAIILEAGQSENVVVISGTENDINPNNDEDAKTVDAELIDLELEKVVLRKCFTASGSTNDFNVTGQPTIASQPQFGTATVNADGSITYCVDDNYINGVDDDMFTYTINGVTVPVTVDIIGRDNPEVFCVISDRRDVNPWVTVLQNTFDDLGNVTGQIDVTPPQPTYNVNVLANDCNYVAASASIVSGPSNGSATIANGVIAYEPDLDFQGLDVITYNLSSNNGEDDETAELFILVGNVTEPVVLPDYICYKGSKFNVGDELTYRIRIWNDGPSVATNVEVADILPGGLDYVSNETTTGIFSDGTGIWTINELAVADTQWVDITVIAATQGEHINCAEVFDVDQQDIDSTPNNNVNVGVGPTDGAEDDQYCVAIRACEIDLEVDKVADGTLYGVGDNVTYTVSVVNFGPDAATGVTLIDRLPEGLAFVSSDGNYSAATGIWNVGFVGVNQTKTLTIVATVLVEGEICNSAEVATANQPDVDSEPDNEPDFENDNDTEDDQDKVVIGGIQSDLELYKTVDAECVNVGEEVTFTVTVENNGGADATGVQAMDQLPACLEFVSANTSVGTYADGSGIWNIGEIAAGEVETLTITAIVLQVEGCTNAAQIIASDQPDPDSDPNNGEPAEDDQDAVTVEGKAIDLELDKLCSDGAVNVGEQMTYTLTLTNNGPSEATNVVVADQLPGQVSYVSASADNGIYSDNTASWTIPSLPAGETATLDIVIVVNEAGTIENSAEVIAADQPDTDSEPGNADENEDDQASCVHEGIQIDLELDKTVDLTEVNVGDQVTYTIEVCNEGPSDATGVQVSDNLPAQVAFVSTSGTYDPATGIAEIGAIAAGACASIDITVEVVEESEEICNIAEVEAAPARYRF